MQLIDDAAHDAGRAAYREGAPLRRVVEQFHAAETDEEFNRAASFGLGYAGGILDELRQLAALERTVAGLIAARDQRIAELEAEIARLRTARES